MKKSLITILIILILGGGGYFAYTKGLIKLDFLGKTEVEETYINEVLKENIEIFTTQQIDEIAKSLDMTKDFEVKYLSGADVWGYQPSGSNLEVIGYIKNGVLYKVSESGSGNYASSLRDFYIQDNKLILSYRKIVSHSGEEVSESKYYFNNETLLKSNILRESKELKLISPKEDVEDYRNYLEKFKKIDRTFLIQNQSIQGTWVVNRYSFGRISAMSEEEANEWIGKNLYIDKDKISFEFSKISQYKNVKSDCTILNLDKPEIIFEDYTDESIYKYYKTNCTTHPFADFTINKNNELIIGWDGVEFTLLKN
jgi:hypothetical protein